jgi:hypothetical protein
MSGVRTELDCAGIRQKHVGSFDITVDLAFLVKVVETQEELTTDDGYLLLGEDTRLKLNWKSA